MYCLFISQLNIQQQWNRIIKKNLLSAQIPKINFQGIMGSLN